MIGTWEIVFTLFIVLLLFGGKRLPELAKSLGLGIKEFKRASSEIQEEIEVLPKESGTRASSYPTSSRVRYRHCGWSPPGIRRTSPGR